MTTFLPAPGTPIEELDTPCLIIDMPALEENIEIMHAFFRSRPAKVRSVTKGHKCPAIAQRQMTVDGAVPYGLCCAKISEAEVMVEAGAKDIRMIEQVVGARKIARLINLAKQAHVIPLVDAVRHIDDLSEAAAAHGITLDVLLEIEIGLNRCGVLPGKPAVDLARDIQRRNNLRFAGIFAHEGAITITDPEARNVKAKERFQRLLNCREDLEREGIPIDHCGAGSTTTWNIAGEMAGITEIDPGAYVLWDQGLADAMPDQPFRSALKMVTTILSRPTSDRAVIDCGHKSIGRSGDGGVPASEQRGASVNRLNSEHGILDLAGEGTKLAVGDQVILVPRYYASAVAAHDHYVCLRDGQVECVWQITARGSHQ